MQHPTSANRHTSGLDDAQAHRILVEWNRTAEPYAATQTVWGLFGQRAQAHPERIAVIDRTAEVAYGRLAARAEAIAAALAARGAQPGALVGVCMDRSWELVATLLGVLRAGCAYVPLDPGYPRERVRYMLDHARAAVAVVDGDAAAALCEGVPAILRLDAIEGTAPAPPGRPSAGDLAYVIYTSGSTGRPKGVAVPHRAVAAMVHAMRGLLGDDELAGVLGAASACFDPSVMELLGTLALGGTVVLADNMTSWPELPAADRVRTVIGVPSAIQAVLAGGWRPAGLRCVVFGGEVLKRPLVDRLHALPRPPRVVNVYGPTEATVFATAAEVAPGTAPITIGRPVPNTRAYILDDALRPVAVGTPGELCLAGDQLARGYLHDPVRTDERFVAPDPDGPVREPRLYRTGDLCRWNGDGCIEFVGRVDQQVKLRGFRIELEEIEAALLSLPGVQGAAAAVVEGDDGRRTLAGYVVARGGSVTGEAARAHVATRLPKYMVPQVVVPLDSLPVLPNGKLDRSRLPAPRPGATGADDAAADAPGDTRAGLLSTVRGEVARVLGLGHAGEVPAHQALESLGMDSLDAVELSHRLGTRLGRKLPASLALEHPTADALVDFLLASTGPGDAAPAPRATRGGRDTLGHLQAQMQSGHPPFLAAKAAAWSASDKGVLVRELQQLLGGQGRDPYGKFLRSGSAHRGTVADAHSGREREAIIWTTNLYLGMNRDPEVMAAARTALDRFGTGMGTSATASGVTDLHLDFEKAFAALVGKPAGCLFPTGYTANVGVVAGLLGEGDVIVMDQLCHASIVDGARASGATIRTFQHNDAADLDAVLASVASPYRTTLVAFEGVYSMGEGAAPVRELVRVAKGHGALVLVDEAHSFGFYGPRGAGICAAAGATGDVDFIMTTLSKALGSLGGVIAASQAHVALLKSAARAYVFQATSTPADIAAALASLRRLSTDASLQQRLWDTTAYMRRRFEAAGFDLGSGDGPIVTPHFGDSDTLYAIARGLIARGIHTAAVTYPIVERGRGRLRFICSAAHTREDVDRTLEALVETQREVEARKAAQARGAADGASWDGAQDAPRADGQARSRVEQWARLFGAHLERALAEAPGPGPELVAAIALPGDAAPVALRIGDLGVEMGPLEAGQPASCTLQFTDAGGASALHDRGVHALLASVLEGGCVLRGAVEPFVWLVARMAEWKRAEAGEAA